MQWVSFTMREIRQIDPSRFAKDTLKFLAAVLGSAAIFTWLGVYKTGDLPFWTSFLFWTATVATGSLAGTLLAPRLWDGTFSHWPGALKVGAVAALVSVPVTLVLFGFNPWVGPAEWPDASTWARQYLYVLVISLMLTTAYYVGTLLDAKRIDVGGTAGTSADPAAIFLERLPAKYRGAALYAVSAEDHYLRVHTNRGEELILMRLADAVRELGIETGLQTHRSWWVAKSAITDVRRSEGKLVVVLPTGAEVPVSRSYQADVKDAWPAK